MARFAIISDLHSNTEALGAVLSRLEKEGVERIVCLGDVVGYGPYPEECYRLVQERASVRLLGNHEHALLKGPRHFNPVAAEAIRWTKKKLGRGSDILKDIRTLKAAHLEKNRLFVHGSVENPLFNYVPEIDTNETYKEIIEVLTHQFEKFDTCFVGHNHRPFLCTMDGTLYPHQKVSTFSIDNQKLYVSVGSVGQPRDRDIRACYVVLDEGLVHYRRVEYDAQKTADAIINRGLPPFLGQRLLEGR